MSMTLCGHCGKAYDESEEGAYCPHCGTHRSEQ